MTFTEYIKKYPPVSKLWAVKKYHSEGFFEVFIPKRHRQFKSTIWEGGLCYKDLSGVMHMFFTWNHDLIHSPVSESWIYSINVSPDNLISVQSDKVIAKKYFQLLHEYSFDYCIDKHYVDN